MKYVIAGILVVYVLLYGWSWAILPIAYAAMGLSMVVQGKIKFN